MKILITGGSGMLGSDVVPILSKKFDVVVPDIDEMDITDSERVFDIFDSQKFDYVLHMAALTDLDWCEDHPDEAKSVNANGTKSIALACQKFGAKLIYVSTSGIFSGRLGRPYTEKDIPKTANVYGQSKYEGELAVEETLSQEQWLILRVGWLFGGGENDKKFVGKIFDKMRTLSKVQAVSNIWGSPNYSVDIGNLISKMLENNTSGLFHIANTGEPASRYDLAVAIRDFAGFTTEIEPVPSSKFPTRAVRPPMEAISSVFMDKYGFEIRHWRDALEEYISRLAKTSNK